MTTPHGGDQRFSGSIPSIYEQHLVPLIFAPYARDLADRLLARAPSSVLELAAGTGVLTREIAARLAGVSIVATDLNPAMLEHAARLGTPGAIEWRQADATRLPFPDRAFDAVVCQFGVMFFPDKAAAFAEARRVLRPGGVLLFNVWDRLEENELEDIVTGALATVFPADPPRFLARVPHGYHDRDTIVRDLAAGGFVASPEITTVAARSRASSARGPAIGFCQGTPLRNEIEARDASRLEEATDVTTEAIAQRFGRGPIDAGMRAHVVVVSESEGAPDPRR